MKKYWNGVSPHKREIFPVSRKTTLWPAFIVSKTMYNTFLASITSLGSMWSVIRNFPTLLALRSHIRKYPGLADTDVLREWIRILLGYGQTLALLTATKIDDMVVSTALSIINDDKAWAAICKVIPAKVAECGVIPIDCMAVNRAVAVASENKAENPVVIFNAIALIIQLISLFKK